MEIGWCNQIIKQNRENIRDQVIQISHSWYRSGRRRWSEFVSVFQCLEMQKVAKEISKKHNVINLDEENYDIHFINEL